MRPQRPCLGLPGYPCGMLTRNPHGRCRPCQQAHDRARNRKRVQYQGAWQTFSRAARAAEPWCHCDLMGHDHDGEICGRGFDLTFDHEYARVECRSCNSSHRRDVGAKNSDENIFDDEKNLDDEKFSATRGAEKSSKIHRRSEKHA